LNRWNKRIGCYSMVLFSWQKKCQKLQFVLRWLSFGSQLFFTIPLMLFANLHVCSKHLLGKSWTYREAWFVKLTLDFPWIWIFTSKVNLWLHAQLWFCKEMVRPPKHLSTLIFREDFEASLFNNSVVYPCIYKCYEWDHSKLV
jgi:hypothetical protein